MDFTQESLHQLNRKQYIKKYGKSLEQKLFFVNAAFIGEELYRDYFEDGMEFGFNFKRDLWRESGSTIGGTIGASMGSAIGGPVGGVALGVCFSKSLGNYAEGLYLNTYFSGIGNVPDPYYLNKYNNYGWNGFPY